MKTKQMLHDTFGSKGNFRAVFFWITIPLTIIGIAARFIPRLAPHLPTLLNLLVYLPVFGFALSFIICTFKAFSHAGDRADAAEQRLKNISVELESKSAGEYVYPKDIVGGVKAHHSVVITLTLIVRNHDGMSEGSIELVRCTTDLQTSPCERVGFETPVIYKGFTEHDSDHRAISAGDIRRLVVTAICDLPIAKTHIAATNVAGILTLMDNRKTPLAVTFSTPLIKNPVQHDRNRSCKVIRKEEGKADIVTYFPNATTLVAIKGSIEAEGYNVIALETVNTPEDETSVCTTTATVELKMPPVSARSE